MRSSKKAKPPSPPRLNSRQRLVLLAFLAGDGVLGANNIYPGPGSSVCRIATIAGVSEETASEIVRDFYQREWLETYMAPGNKRICISFNKYQYEYARYLVGIRSKLMHPPKVEHYLKP